MIILIKNTQITLTAVRGAGGQGERGEGIKQNQINKHKTPRHSQQYGGCQREAGMGQVEGSKGDKWYGRKVDSGW